MVSRTMKPSLVSRAQAECTLPPTKYRLSKTFAASAYHVSRGGAVLGSRTNDGTLSVVLTDPSAGRRHRRVSAPRNSNPAACCAARIASSISRVKSRCGSAVLTGLPCQPFWICSLDPIHVVRQKAVGSGFDTERLRDGF